MGKETKSENIFSSAIAFVKGNLSIIYSFLLLVFIPAAFFANYYLMTSNFEKAIDLITQRNAVIVENVVNNLIQDRSGDTAYSQAAIDRVKKENETILLLSILEPAGNGGFTVAASSDRSTIGQIRDDDKQSLLAWSSVEPFASIDESGGQRFWKVTKQLYDGENNKIGLVEASFSLDESDLLINGVISDSYWVLVITILVAVLLIANQARLLNYAITVSKLKEVDKMKDMFISMASHELRSPLTAIRWYVDALKEKKEVVADEESRLYVGNLAQSATRLNNLVEDILEVSRIEGNHLPMEAKVFDAGPVVAQSVEETRPQATEKSLALNLASSPDSIFIEADPNRLKQVMINLVSNAIKYTPKGSIDVSMTVKNDELLITVADTGIGISAEDQAKLFKKFSRITNDKTRDVIGTGLGLWITLEIAKRMKGKITVESIEGVGSHFTVHLPLAKK